MNNDDDERVPPVFAVVAGLPGVGKTTVLDQLKGEMEFPQHLVVDLPTEQQSTEDLIVGAVALRQSVAVESSFETPTVLRWMNMALERGFVLELVLIGVEGDALASLRSKERQRTRRQLEDAQSRMSVAVDMARRVLIIDNSTAQPSVAARIDAGQVRTFDNRPGWVARRVLAPRAARQASLAAIRSAYDAIAARAPVQPLLQMAAASAGAWSGAVVARSEFHVLQQVGEALHVIHDLGMLGMVPGGTLALAAESVIMIAYEPAQGPQLGPEQ